MSTNCLKKQLKAQISNDSLMPYGYWKFDIVARQETFVFTINKGNAILKIIGDAEFLDENNTSLGKTITLPSGWNEVTVRVSSSDEDVSIYISGKYRSLNGLYWSDGMIQYIRADLSMFRWMDKGINGSVSAAWSKPYSINNKITGSLNDIGYRIYDLYLYNNVITGDFTKFANEYPWIDTINVLELPPSIQVDLDLIHNFSFLNSFSITSTTIGSCSELARCPRMVFLDVLERNTAVQGSIEGFAAVRKGSWLQIKNYQILTGVTYNGVPLSEIGDFPSATIVIFDFDAQGNVTVRS